MSQGWTGLPAWVSEEGARALESDDPDDVLAACVTLGKLLRSRRARAVCEQARDRACALMASETSRVALSAAVAQRGDEAIFAAQRILGRVSERLDPAPGEIQTCALLRDDLEALRVCTATALLAATEQDTSTRAATEQLDACAATFAGAVDMTLAPVLSVLRTSWLRAARAGAPVPAELAELVESGSNPWWLDLFDPAWTVLEPKPQENDSLDLAAATLDEETGPDRQWRFERGIDARLVRRHDGAYRVTLRSEAIADVAALSVAWLKDGKRTTIPLESTVRGLWEGIVDRTLLASPVVYLVVDGRLVVREP